MFRLLNNLDFVTSAAGPDGIPFRPSVLDLAGLCRQIARDAGQLLQQDTHLEYRSDLPSLLIQGDIPLLQRMLLGLISNSVQTMRGGVVLLSLRRQGDRAVLSLTDSGERPSDRQLAALLQQDTDQAIPQPGQGAGLGLSVVRHIAALHRGTMLVEWGEGPGHSHLSACWCPGAACGAHTGGTAGWRPIPTAGRVVRRAAPSALWSGRAGLKFFCGRPGIRVPGPFYAR